MNNYYLDADQANFLVTLTKPTEASIPLKLNVVLAFKEAKALPSNVEMDAFSILVQLAAKGVLPIAMLRVVSNNLNPEDLEFRERMIGYTEAALAHKK